MADASDRVKNWLYRFNRAFEVQFLFRRHHADKIRASRRRRRAF